MKKWITAYIAVSLISGNIFPQHTPHCHDAKIRAAERIQQMNWPKNASMDLYDVKYHKLDLSLTNTSTYITGVVTTQAIVTGPQLSTFVFELHPSLTIDSVKVDGIPVSVGTNGVFKECTLPSAITENTLFTAEIWYNGTPTATGMAAIGSGITTDYSPSWGNQVTWTLSEPYSAYEWWPCKQSLTDKIDSVDVWITVGDSLKAGANGVLQNITALSGNRLRYEWKHRYPIDYYLISASVAKYVEYSFYAFPNGNTDSVLIQNYIYDNPQTLPYFKQQIDLTKDFIELFADKFGPYPFENEKYGHCMAPFGGGMEHQTMTTQGSFSFALTAHELGHQWFGNKVTCGSWKDIWVNEGFASYSEYVALENLSPNQARTHMDNWHNSAMSQLGGSVYVADTSNPNNIFSGRLSYDKGATLVHMLRFLVNDDILFFQTLKNFLQDHAYATATGENVRQAFETYTGLSLSDFFDDYYYGEGYPTFSLRWNQSPTGEVLLKLSQTASVPSVTPLFRIPVEIRFRSPQGDTTIRVMSDATEVSLDFQHNKAISLVQIDPNQWILNQTGTIQKDANLSLKEVQKNFVHVYPSPASDIITMKEFTIGETAQIISSNGKRVRTFTIQHTEQTLSVQGLANGTYFLQTSSGKFPFLVSR